MELSSTSRGTSRLGAVAIDQEGRTNVNRAREDPHPGHFFGSLRDHSPEGKSFGLQLLTGVAL
jgi:hypothetical protein